MSSNKKKTYLIIGQSLSSWRRRRSLRRQLKPSFFIIQSMFEKNFYCISSRIENSGQLYGCFKIGPFYRHQSLTFANALRRTLLADRSRCTLNAIQINDVEHEFSSLIGVRESVVDILLNLEKLIFQIKKPITKPQVAFIHFCGPGILRAQHICLPSNFKCVIPSQYIATLEVDGKLTLKLFFSPNWNQFQFFFQNLIRLKPSFEKGGSRGRAVSPKAQLSKTKKINKLIRQSGGKSFQKHLKNLFKYRYILHEKIHPKARQSFNLTKIFNNRLKIVHYLTNNLFRNHHRYLQLLSIPFRAKPQLKIPISVSATKATATRADLRPLRRRSSRQPLAKQGSFVVYNPKKSFSQYKTASPNGGPSQTNYKRGPVGAEFLKNQKSSSFEPKIQENFLFLNHSLCAIEKVNYALQGQNPSLEAEANLSPFSEGSIPKQNNLTDNIKKVKAQLAPTKKHAKPQLKCHLKLNSHSHIQRKLSVCSSPNFLGSEAAPSKKAQITQDLFQTQRPPQQRVAPSQKNSRSFDPNPRSGLPDKVGGEAADPKGATPLTSPNSISKNEEFILFEVWTDGSILPQTAILRAINELLLEMFPYSLQISKYAKIHQISNNNNKSKDLLNPIGPRREPGLTNSPALLTQGLKGAKFPDLSKKSFRERFLNLEIGNFYFDLETYIFLKKRKIHRIIDFFQFLNQKELGPPSGAKKNMQTKPGIQMTLDQFQNFLHSFIQ